MPEVTNHVFCSEQIHIPPSFPHIMKLYCKAAIRTQPYDLIKWSASYFRALSSGEALPVKERIEYPPYESVTGLTPGYIRVLIKQVGKDPTLTISFDTLMKKWNALCLPEDGLMKIISLLGVSPCYNWFQFVAVAAGTVSKSLTQTMILVCELLTDEPEGGMASIPLDVFVDLYKLLAYMNCDSNNDEISLQTTNKESNLSGHQINSDGSNKIDGEPIQFSPGVEDSSGYSEMDKEDAEDREGKLSNNLVELADGTSATGEKNFDKIQNGKSASSGSDINHLHQTLETEVSEWGSGPVLIEGFTRESFPGIGPACLSDQVEKVLEFVTYWAQKQSGMVMPRNIRHWMCPPLDKEF